MRFVDLFAGAGSLGLESWSRGAELVTLVEQHPQVMSTLKKNVEALQNDQLGKIECLKTDALKCGKQLVNKQYDIILIDPPYDLENAMELVLAEIKTHSLLTDDGIVVYELRASDAYEVPAAWDLIKNKKYGYTRVLTLKLR